jgi:hypothetical protein
LINCSRWRVICSFTSGIDFSDCCLPIKFLQATEWVKLERENLVKDWLLDWRFKETELKKLRRRRRLFGKELLMSFSNSQQSLFFFLDLDLAERCREREEGDWLAAKLEKLILALACRCMYEILFYYNIFILKYIKIIFLFLI